MLNNSGFIAHKRQSGEGKQPLVVHLSETGELARKFASKIALDNLGELLGLLHDFGKYSSEFQAYIKSATGEWDQDHEAYVDAELLKGKVDHSTAGAQFLYERLSSLDKRGKEKLLAQVLAACIASHHSGLIDMLSVDFEKADVFGRRISKADSKTHLSECVRNAPEEFLGKVEQLLLDRARVEEFFALLQRLIPNLKEAFGTRGSFQLGFLTRFLFSCLIDADRLNSAEFEQPRRLVERKQKSVRPDWDIAIGRLEAKLSGLTPASPIDHIRRKISDECLARALQQTGVYSLTVPTGGGKTYASLRYALHHAKANKLERIFYVIPFTSIIEQNAKVMRETLESDQDQHPWILEHHSNLEPENQTWQSKLASENWDAPIVITTMVQFLETMFSGGTRGVRRLHQFAKSVIVFDEIQTLPIKCVHLFCNAINFLVDAANASVLLCTATQPVLDQLNAPQKGQLKLSSNHELMTGLGLTKLFAELRRVRVENRIKPGGWLDQDIAEFALEQFMETGSCLVIVNTKEWAQRLYKLCEKAVPADSIFHLSTNQCPAHRKTLLDTISERLKPENSLPVLCFSTQLIEAGVDVDFASVIRFLAGLDSIAQAAGRCNRNGRRDMAFVYVVNPDKENTQRLQDIEVGKDQAARVLDESFEDFLAPEAIEQYFRYYFFDQQKEMAYKCQDSEGKGTTLLELLSTHSSNPCNKNRPREASNHYFPLLQQAFMEAGRIFKAIDAPTQSVIVPFDRGEQLINELCAIAKEFDLGRYYQLLRQAQKFSVNVFPHVWDKLVKAEAVHEIQKGEGIYYLKEEYYSSAFGLSYEPITKQSSYVV